MKKFLALLLTVAFGSSVLMVAGCAPKQEATQEAPAMEEAAPATDEAMPAMEEGAGSEMKEGAGSEAK